MSQTKVIPRLPEDQIGEMPITALFENMSAPPAVAETRQRLEALFKKGNEGRDYRTYTWLMDAALEAKAQSLFPHFGDIKPGDLIVDAGSGTGKLAEYMARYFDRPRVVALDISHELQESAADGQALVSLAYGDAREQNFPDNSVKVKCFSTSGHEIESYGGPGSMIRAAEVTLRELVPGGRMVDRDFCKPSLEEPIYMEILVNDGVEEVPDDIDTKAIDYNTLSTKALLKRFAREFRNGQEFSYETVEIEGKKYIKILPEWAHEFYLRKDYTGNWRQEIKEKYTYWTLEEAKKILKDIGYTTFHAFPDPNEYILSKRLRGKIALHRKVGSRLFTYDFPPTHMVVVGEKSRTVQSAVLFEPTPSSQLFNTAKYHELLEDIDVNGDSVRIGDRTFAVTSEHPKIGTKKRIFTLAGEPKRFLKVVRDDTYNHHNAFKSLSQIIQHQKVLDDYEVPSLKILDYEGKAENKRPPFRYVIQEAAPEGSVSAAELIENGRLTEVDIQQMCRIVNDFELNKQWQLDTNPFSWFRVKQEDGTTQMVYASGKVYRYDERWEFRKVGLLQWLDPKYIKEGQYFSAAIPKVKAYRELQQKWTKGEGQAAIWKQHLDPKVHPLSLEED